MTHISPKGGGCTRQSKSDWMCGMIVGKDAQPPRTSKLECLACMCGGLSLQWWQVGWQQWRQHCILARFLSLTLGFGGSGSRVLIKLTLEERRSTAHHGNPRSMRSASAHTWRGTFGRTRTCKKRPVMKEKSAWIFWKIRLGWTPRRPQPILLNNHPWKGIHAGHCLQHPDCVLHFWPQQGHHYCCPHLHQWQRELGRMRRKLLL